MSMGAVRPMEAVRLVSNRVGRGGGAGSGEEGYTE